jgi:hypothetical protein
VKTRAIPLAILACLLLGADVHFETQRVRDGEVSRGLVDTLAAQKLRASARAFWLPSAYSAVERNAELRQLESGLAAVLRGFGSPSAIEPTDASVQIYGVTVGSGPRPAWWEQEPGFVEARKYVYAVSFARLGRGYVVVTTALGKAEQVVSVSFGLPSAKSGSQAEVAAVFSQLLDVHGVPGDHPVRTSPIPPVNLPALDSK